MTRLKEAAAPIGLLAIATLFSCDAAAAPDTADELVVGTGTRAQGHTEANSAVPILVYDSEDLQGAGFGGVGRALEALSPSINVPHAQTTPSAANNWAVSMKGMSPDQVLVLI